MFNRYYVSLRCVLKQNQIVVNMQLKKFAKSAKITLD